MYPMANCISCDKRYYLDDTGCTLRFCTQECLRSYTADKVGPGWAGDINEVFEERDRLRDEVKQEYRNGIVAALHEVELLRDIIKTDHTNWDALQRAVVRIREHLKVEGAPQAGQLLAELRLKVVKLKMAIGFFSSGIKSGEGWTNDCEKYLREAMDDE